MRSMLMAASALLFAPSFAAAEGLKDLEGSYTVEAATKGGVDVPETERKKVTFVFKADEMTMKTADRAVTAKIKVDSTKMPMTIEISPADGPEKGKTFPGIYKIENGELLLAFNERGDRPTEFKGDGDVALMKLKKEEPKK